MAVNWIASFKAIPWTKVLAMAPSIVDGARKLWTSVAPKSTQAMKLAEPPAEKTYSTDPVISAIEKQTHALELRTDELEEKVVISSEILDKLAEQQTQLVRAVDVLRIRTRGLLWICGFLALVLVVLTYFLVVR